MKKILLLTFILLLFALTLAMIGFNDDNASIVSYLNNGGIISESQSSQSPNELDNPVWTIGTQIPLRRYHGAGTIYQRNDTSWLYCLGGDYTEAGDPSLVNSIYNINTDTWSIGDSMPSPGSFYGTAATLGDTIYYVGGIGQGGQFTSETDIVYRYHVPTNTWSAGRNFPYTSADAECEPYQDSLIYIIGGLINGTASATSKISLYNRISGYRGATPLPEARWGFASAIVNNTIIVVCGSPSYGGSGFNTVYRGEINQTDRSSITWTTGASYPGQSRIRFDGNLWGCDGIITGLGCASGWCRSTECYVYKAGSWIGQPPAPGDKSAAFYGSTYNSSDVWKWLAVSGFRIWYCPETEIFTDTLCRPQPPVQLTQCRHLPNLPIINLTTTRDTIIISGNNTCNITDVNVRIDTVFHTYDSELYFVLRHGATSSNLITRRGGSGDNFIRTVLDDSALVPISSGTAPFTGSFRPEQPLSIFNNMIPSGLWLLEISDSAGIDSGYLRSWCMVISFTCPVGGIQTKEIPFAYNLSQNYPNPFNPITTIKFGLPKPGNTKLVVYDILGRIVTTLVNEFKDAGTYNASFDGTNLASGVYFYSLESGSYKETKKMLLIK